MDKREDREISPVVSKCFTFLFPLNIIFYGLQHNGVCGLIPGIGKIFDPLAQRVGEFYRSRCCCSMLLHGLNLSVGLLTT